MNLILGVDPIRPPLTGIGVCTSNLCRELLARKDLSVTGLTRFGLLKEEQLADLLEQLSSEPACAGNAAGLIALLRKSFTARAKESSFVRYLYHKTAQIVAARNLQNMQEDAIYHAPNFIGYGKSQRKIVTIHDLSHLEFPEMHPESRVRFMNNWLEKSILESAHIIVDTDFIRHQLLESGMLGIHNESKISVVPLGVDDDFSKFAQADELSDLHHYSLKQDGFILSIGTLEPRKNYERLVRAYLQLPDEVAAEFPLVICGVRGWKYEQLLNLVSTVASPYKVIITDYAPQSVMVSLMKNCRVFIYPSLYEGFGLPILEAMKCGVPVITSEIGSMAEVAGDAARLVDPCSIKSIKDALIEMLDSKQLRDKFVSLGHSHSRKFTWRNTANKTVEIYHKV